MTSSYRQRQRQIAEVLIRYEMGHLLEVFGLERFVSLERRLLRRGAARTRPESLRVALEDFGPTFIKLGQVLSTRADLLPPDFQAELAKLQDDTNRVSPEVIEETISSELGAAATELFASFDPEPVASASIGQVHAAGTPRRHRGGGQGAPSRQGRRGRTGPGDPAQPRPPGEPAMEGGRALGSEQSGARLRRPPAGRASTILQEAGNAQEFAANFAAEPGVRIPSIYPELTTSRIITLERIKGRKISDVAGLDTTGVDRAALAGRLATTVAQMVLVDGFYHGDPQPGNFFVEPGGRIGIVDFGRVGRIDDNLRARLSRLLMALIQKDPDRLTSALLALRVPTAPVDRERLRQDLSELLARYSGHAIRDVPIGAAITEVLDVVRRHNLIISPELALLFAVLIMDESITEELDPDFRFENALRPYVERHLASSLSPGVLARRAEQFGIEIAELAGELPGQLHRLLDTLGDGQFEVHLRTSELDPLVGRVERLANQSGHQHSGRGRDRRASPNWPPTTNPGRGWRRPVVAAGVGVLTSLTAYRTWRRSPIAAHLDRLRIFQLTNTHRSQRPSPRPED